MRAKSLFVLGGLSLCLTFSGTALAEGNPQQGALKAQACLGCHGVDGYRNGYPSYRVPKLGGQHPEYIISALQDYRAGNRQHETMKAQAAGLGDQDILDIAAYFAQQTR